MAWKLSSLTAVVCLDDTTKGLAYGTLCRDGETKGSMFMWFILMHARDPRLRKLKACCFGDWERAVSWGLL
jgi:hypothetical protein